MQLSIWTVYAEPEGCPHPYSARLFVNGRPTDQVLVADTLDGVRAQLPAYLTRMVRDPEDVPEIVESWI